MNLAIDIGNTATKIGAFKGGELQSRVIMEGAPDIAIIHRLRDTHPEIANAIVSTVGPPDNTFLSYLGGFFNLVELSATTRLPFKNKYETPETLGNDRIAGVAGLRTYIPFNTALCIDAGTCITFDLITEDNEYLGGAISPGLEMRFKALNTFTSRLPLITPDGTFKDLIGTTTESSIRAGVQEGLRAEINGIIENYEALYPDLEVVITGGNAEFFAKRLKKRIFVAPNLVLEGLNQILNYNVAAQ